jgi:hypothetical protein
VSSLKCGKHQFNSFQLDDEIEVNHKNNLPVVFVSRQNEDQNNPFRLIQAFCNNNPANTGHCALSVVNG